MAETLGSNNPVRVVVIEDNDDDRELLRRQLKKSGMDSQVKFIANGQEALDFLTGPYARDHGQELIAVFLDLKLPAVNGIELLRHIRTSENLQKLPVIVMTSSNNPKDLEECRRLKATSYVPKPISFAIFSKAVADIFHLPSDRATPGLQE